MLRMQMQLAETTAGAWSEADERWTADGNYLEPFRSPALNFTHERRGTVEHFVVRERRPDGDSITIDVACSSVRVEAGALGVAPLYVATADDTIHASWNVADSNRDWSTMGDRCGPV